MQLLVSAIQRRQKRITGINVSDIGRRGIRGTTVTFTLNNFTFTTTAHF